MGITDAIINYRRSLKRHNYSKYTIRNYMSTLKQYIIWLKVPVETASHKDLIGFIDLLLLAATGAIISGTLLDEMERADLETGLATLCIASGMGAATIIERV